MREFLIGLFPVVLPVLVASLTMWGFERVQDLIALVDALPAFAKQIAVVVIAYMLTAAGAALGVTISTDLAAITPADLSALLSAGLAFVFHQGVKTKAALS